MDDGLTDQEQELHPTVERGIRGGGSRIAQTRLLIEGDKREQWKDPGLV